MVDWEPLHKLRSIDYDDIDSETNDVGLEFRECPEGHRSVTLAVMMGFTYDDLEDLKKKKAKMAREPGKCRHCGKEIPADAPIRHLHATYLPISRSDLYVSILPTGESELALVAPGGRPAPATPQDPALREIGAASYCRGAAVALGFGNADEAVKELGEALRLWPDYPPAMAMMGKILKRKGDLAGARPYLEAALAGGPDLPEASFYLADLLDEVGEERRALELYDRAAVLRPRDPQVFVQRGVLKARLGMREAALPDYQQALAIDAHHELALVNLAVNFHHLGRHAEIPEVLSQLRPSDIRDENQLRRSVIGITMECAERHIRANEMFDAARCYELAAGFMPNDASVLFNWGLCLANCGALADSAIRLRQALRLNPGHEKARNMLPQVEKACSKAGEGLLAMHQHHSIMYIDSTGRGMTMLNYLVKIETNRRYLESEVNRLSTSRDKDLVKLLVAKGHNKRVSFGMEGRTIEIKLKDIEPDPDFIALANATSWITSSGKTVESAVVPVYLSVGDSKSERLLTNPKGGPPFRLNRVAEMDKDKKDERFYPPGFAGYDDGPK